MSGKAGAAEAPPKWDALAAALAEIRLWSVARPVNEINRDKNRILSGEEPGLIAYWPLNDEGGTEIKDNAFKEDEENRKLGFAEDPVYFHGTATNAQRNKQSWQLYCHNLL